MTAIQRNALTFEEPYSAAQALTHPSATLSPLTPRSALSSPSSALNTPAELALADIWIRILGLDASETLTPNTSFLELGAKSISVIRMVSAAKSSGFTFSVLDVYANSGLANLADRR
ncbi:hypothetical protein HDU86_008533 [Geranomyces michiganensis]|nr:hypothetical protein HDU86_008533 [Geranomyces michiganensis]